MKADRRVFAHGHSVNLASARATFTAMAVASHAATNSGLFAHGFEGRRCRDAYSCFHAGQLDFDYGLTTTVDST